MSHNPQNNPYAKAAGAYATSAQTHAGDQRELEARVLLKSNRQLQDLIENWDSVTNEALREALNYNRQIWLLFYDTALENKDGDRPNDLRSNIVNLANFIFKREIEILATPTPQKQKLDILMTINREIAAGLMTQNAQSKAAAAQQNTVSTTAGTSTLSSSTDIQS
jgi:flagellar protein FlaF